MTTVAAILVIVGAATLFLAGEALDDLFFIGLISSRWRQVAPTWMRRSMVAIPVGVALIVAGLLLLRYARQ